MRPRLPFLLLLVPWLVVAGFAIADPAWMVVWWAYGALVALLATVSIWRLRRLALPSVVRIVDHALPLGVEREVQLQIDYTERSAIEVLVYDHHPAECVVAVGMPVLLQLTQPQRRVLRYRIQPTQRGDLHFGQIQLVLHRRFGLFRRSVHVGSPQSVRVFPNFAALSRHALLAIDDRVHHGGIRRRRRRGSGMDFHQLREYRQGDLLRQIDWKATSRRRQLISREYQEERDQQVVLVLDCGRRMNVHDGALSHFDHTLNAALLLTYVAQAHGDAVGLITFSSGEPRFLKPRKGRAGLQAMLDHVYDLQATMRPSDYTEAANRVMHLLPRRALVVILTNLRDEDGDEVAPALEMLRHRHLVLLASLRETGVEELTETWPAGLSAALGYCAAQDYVAGRRAALAELAGRGAQVLDVLPKELPGRIVNRYLDIKRAGVL